MEEYNLKEKVKIINQNEPKRNTIKNSLLAFLFGGLICAIGEGIYLLYSMVFEQKQAESFMLLTLIFIASIFTCFGLYDRLGQIAGCGTIVPITGFANSMTSSAMESRSEGVVVGILNNIFKLAGSVIVVAILCGVVSGLIRYLGGVLFG